MNIKDHQTFLIDRFRPKPKKAMQEIAAKEIPREGGGGIRGQEGGGGIRGQEGGGGIRGQEGGGGIRGQEGGQEETHGQEGGQEETHGQEGGQEETHGQEGGQEISFQVAKSIAIELVGKLKAHPTSYSFLMPVDPIAHGCPDYLQVINDPVDVSSLESTLKSLKEESSLESTLKSLKEEPIVVVVGGAQESIVVGGAQESIVVGGAQESIVVGGGAKEESLGGAQQQAQRPLDLLSDRIGRMIQNCYTYNPKGHHIRKEGLDLLQFYDFLLSNNTHPPINQYARDWKTEFGISDFKKQEFTVDGVPVPVRSKRKSRGATATTTTRKSYSFSSTAPASPGPSNTAANSTTIYNEIKKRRLNTKALNQLSRSYMAGTTALTVLNVFAK